MFQRPSNVIKQLDIFGSSLSFKVNGNTTYSTWPGAVISLVVYLLVAIYAVQKCFVMLQHGDTLKQETAQKVDMNEMLDYKTTDQVPFDIAFGLFTDQNLGFGFAYPISLEDARGYVDVKMKQTSMSIKLQDQKLIQQSQEEILEETPCVGKYAEPFLGLAYEGSVPVSQEELDFFSIQCLKDKSRVKFQGVDRFSQAFTIPSIEVTLCRENCKPTDEIEEFVEDLYLIMFLRTQYYNSTNYDGNVVNFKLEYFTHRITIDPNTYAHGHLKITEESLESDDKLYSLGIFAESNTFHTVQEDLIMKEQSKAPGSDKLLEIDFTTSPERREHVRVIYGPLDFLGDVGGLSDALFGIGSILITLIQAFSGDPITSYLLSRLFYRDNTHRSTLNSQGTKSLLVKKRKHHGMISSYCLTKRQKRLLDASQKRIDKELDIVNYIRQSKYIRVMMETLFSQKERFLISRNKRFVIDKNNLEPQSSSDDQEFQRFDTERLTQREAWLLKQAFSAQGKYVGVRARKRSEKPQSQEISAKKHTYRLKLDLSDGQVPQSMMKKGLEYA